MPCAKKWTKNDHEFIELGPTQVNFDKFRILQLSRRSNTFGLYFITQRAVEKREWQSLREIYQVVFQKNERQTPRLV